MSLESSDHGAKMPLPTDMPGSEEERRAYRSARSNMLLVGSDAVVNALITAITGRPADDLRAWNPDLPLVDANDDTLVVRDIQQLTESQQQRLNRDLEAWSGRVRFIATAAWPVYPHVARGEFHEGLYYRLNMVCIEPSTGWERPVEATSRP